MKPSDKGSTASTPASFAQELGAPLQVILQALKDLGFEDAQEGTLFAAEDQQALLRALRRKLAEEERDPDGEKRRRADAAFETHGDTLMMIPGVMGTWVDFDHGRQTYAIVVAVNQAPENIKGLPSEVDGVPVIPNETGAITAG